MTRAIHLGLALLGVLTIATGCASTPEVMTQPNVALEIIKGSPSAFGGIRRFCIHASDPSSSEDLSEVIRAVLEDRMGALQSCVALEPHISIQYSSAPSVCTPCPLGATGPRFAFGLVQARTEPYIFATAEWSNTGGGSSHDLARAFARALTEVIQCQPVP